MNTTHEFAATASPSAAGTSAEHDASAGPLPLRRPVAGRMLAGVAAGVARSLGVDPVITRIAFVILTLAGGAGIPLYLAGWLLIPDERSGHSVAAEVAASFSGYRR